MIKIFKSLVTVIPLILISCTGNNEQNKSDFERKHLFNYDWKFALGDYPEASSSDFNDSNWRMLDLPHDWSIEGEMNPSNPTGNDGGYFPAGIAWYRKSFHAPSDWQNKNISIYFEGVYMNSEVFINGHSLGVYPYGYSSFLYDITPHLNYDQENIIAVKVDNSLHKNSRWYSGSGIYRHAWLYVTEPIHIDHWGVFITTPEITPEKAIVQVSTVVKNSTDIPQNITLSTLLRDKNSRNAGKNETKIEIPAGGEEEIIQSIVTNNPKLWSTDDPNLYTAQISVKQDNTILDRKNSTFGIRSISFSTDKGFQLNGETLLINGGNVHHDHGALGAASYDRAEERKVELLKEAGFNAVRTAHNHFSPAFYDACDRLGLLVMNEAFDGWRVPKTPYDYANYFDEWWKKDIESMVLRDRNHPSIIMWSTGNEVLERTEPQAVETGKMLADYVRELDPTRPVTSGMTSWNQGWEIFDPLFAVHDIGGYNYQIHHAESDHERVPSRIILQTESYPGAAFSNWNMVQKNSYVIGDFVWTAMDYLGESGIGAYFYPGETAGGHWEKDLYPWHGAYCGDIDLTGWRKPISHYRSLLWNDDEKLYMAVREPNPANGRIQLTGWAVWPTWESWTWPGYTGNDIEVEVYSKYPSVRLYLNDKFIEEKQTTFKQEFKTVFSLPYEPGVLKAVGIEGDQEVESVELITAGETRDIKLNADRAEISANGQDLSFVTVELTDAEGVLQPNAENKLTFNISGPGKIAGVTNANLKDTTSYISHTRKAWNGRALVVIRSKREEGTITLNVSSPGLPGAVVNINSIYK